MGTGGLISDAREMRAIVDGWLPSTAAAAPVTMIVDLGGVVLAPAALKEMVVRIGEYAKVGQFGEAKVVFATSENATAELLGLIARQYRLPLFLAASSKPADVAQAVPTGDLTETDLSTLADIQQIGTAVTVSRLAAQIGLEQTAANNRLASLSGKGYVFRISRSRREGDLYLDPRMSLDQTFDQLSRSASPGLREALLSKGIDTDPYDTSPLLLSDTEAAELRAMLDRRQANGLPKIDG
jgi:DNA-binding MarR family transcriptional regulator